MILICDCVSKTDGVDFAWNQAGRNYSKTNSKFNFVEDS